MTANHNMMKPKSGRCNGLLNLEISTCCVGFLYSLCSNAEHQYKVYIQLEKRKVASRKRVVFSRIIQLPWHQGNGNFTVGYCDLNRNNHL